MIEGRSLWATIAFAVAVFGGALGCVLMLMKRSLTVLMFGVSSAGVLIQLVPSVQIATTSHSFTVFEIALAFCGPVVVALFLIWYSSRCRKGQLLR